MIQDDFAIFGGSFNPIHNGHLNLIYSVFKNTSINNIILIPTYISPFKQNATITSVRDRVKMLYLAAYDFYKMFSDVKDKSLSIDETECNSKTVSYTYKTIERYKKEFCLKKVKMIIGDDILLDLHLWKNIDYLKENVTFLLGERDGQKEILKKRIKEGFEIITIKNQIFKCSSSEIRTSLFTKDLLSPSVYEYIKNNNLYSINS